MNIAAAHLDYVASGLTTALSYDADGFVAEEAAQTPFGTLQFSPYVFCAAHPVKYIDMTGCEFTASSMYYVNMYLQEIQRREDEANAIIEMQNNLISSGTLSEKQIKKANKQIAKANKTLAEMGEIRAEISELDISTQLYSIVYSTKLNDNPDPTNDYAHSYNRSGMGFHFQSSTAVIILTQITVGHIAHEMKHVYQFEHGDISVSRDGGDSYFYDQQDEYYATERGNKFGFNPGGDTKSAYKKLQRGPAGVKSILSTKQQSDPDFLQKFAERKNIAFRFGGTTYVP